MDFDKITINYRVGDRFDSDWPPYRYVTHIYGEILGVDKESGEETNLGKIRLAKIHLWEMDEARIPRIEVLDEDAEWAHLLGVEIEENYQTALVVESVVIKPEARGHKLGLLAAARAIRQWADDNTLVSLKPGAYGSEVYGENDPSSDEALLAYWLRLGLVPDPDVQGVLVGDGGTTWMVQLQEFC